MEKSFLHLSFLFIHMYCMFSFIYLPNCTINVMTRFIIIILYPIIFFNTLYFILLFFFIDISCLNFTEAHVHQYDGEKISFKLL